MRFRFQYVVVRYIPNVVRDEAVNVGVLVRGLEGGDFAARFLPRSTAVRKLWPTADTRLVSTFEREIKSVTGPQTSLFAADQPLLERFGHPAEPGFFDRARKEFTGNLQMTEPRGYLAAGLKGAIDWAYTTYVQEPLSGPRPINYQALAPVTLRTRLWTAFERKHLISPSLVKRQLVVTGMHAPWTFDLAFTNGALNLISSIALNSSAVETNLGRSLVFRGMIEDVKEQDKAHGVAVVQLPKEGTTNAGVVEAQGILRDAGIDIFNVTELPQLVDWVSAELPHRLPKSDRVKRPRRADSTPRREAELPSS